MDGLSNTVRCAEEKTTGIIVRRVLGGAAPHVREGAGFVYRKYAKRRFHRRFIMA